MIAGKLLAYNPRRITEIGKPQLHGHTYYVYLHAGQDDAYIFMQYNDSKPCDSYTNTYIVKYGGNWYRATYDMVFFTLHDRFRSKKLLAEIEKHITITL